MYNQFYGFKENPFNLTPNPRFFFPSPKHTDALDSLMYAIDQRKGFIVITGEIGSGKTTVCRTLLSRLESNTQVALITNTHLNSKDLLTMILEDLGIDIFNGSKAQLLSQLHSYLMDQFKQENNVVLIIDEAQNLNPEVLEEIRMLSNLETETEKLIQIVLLGQPELREKLALSRLVQLRQRVAVYFHLSPLTKTETTEYILHRLKIASGSDHQYLTPGALQLVYKFSKGIPRLINQVCDNAFLTGYLSEIPVIYDRIMQEVVEEAPMEQFRKLKTREYAVTS
jgi:general secretion pathway protein A